MSVLVYAASTILGLLSLGAAFILYYAHGYTASVKPAVPGTIRIACVGDSITYGALVRNRKINCYPAQLERRLGHRYSVRNFGVNGHSLQKTADKPYWQHKHFQKSTAFDPNIVLLMLGTNDSQERNWKGIEAFNTDYRSFISHYKALPAQPDVYAMTPPTEFSVKKITEVSRSRCNELLDEMTAAIVGLAAEMDIRVIDINRATKDHPEFFKFDGVHPNADGAAFIAETVYRALVLTRE